jgi:hypothetical protein
MKKPTHADVVKYQQQIGKNMGEYIDTHLPTKGSDYGYSTKYRSVTKDEIQQMLDAMRREMTAEIIQQVCDEIAKLGDR